MKKALYFSLLALAFFSCKEEVSLTFSEEAISSENNAIIEVIYPKAKGNLEAANAINHEIEALIAYSLNIDEKTNSHTIVDESLKLFESNFTDFKKDFPENNQQWEVHIEGEIIHESSELICIAMTIYLDTGGAHGNGTITFLNFDPETGKKFETSDLLKDSNGFSELVNTYFKQEVSNESDLSMKDFFFGDDFKLPSTLGFSEEGVIILYNTYEIAPYSEGVTEFTIPYEDTNGFLTTH